MSNAPVNKLENTERVKIRAMPSATRPDTERVRSSAQVSFIWPNRAKENAEDVSALGAAFLRLPLVVLPFAAGS